MTILNSNCHCLQHLDNLLYGLFGESSLAVQQAPALNSSDILFTLFDLNASVEHTLTVTYRSDNGDPNQSHGLLTLDSFQTFGNISASSSQYASLVINCYPAPNLPLFQIFAF